MFLTVFQCFAPFLIPKVNRSGRSLLSHSFFKEQRELFCTHCSLQKSDCEQIAPVDLYKRATMSDSLFFSRANAQTEEQIPNPTSMTEP